MVEIQASCYLLQLQSSPCRYLRLSLLFKPGVGHDQAGLESSPCAWSGSEEVGHA